MRRRKYKNFKSGTYNLSLEHVRAGDARWFVVGDHRPYYRAHSTRGPMYRSWNLDEPLWLYHGMSVKFDDWCIITDKTEDEIVEMKLKYGT